MKPDISNRDDIEKLINTFYEKVKTDEVIGYFFTDVVKVNWEKHLPKMYDFWENIVFYTGKYVGNVTVKHQDLHKKSPLKTAHFERWIQLFDQSVDELFEGENAILIKQRALSVSTVIQIKVFS